MKELNMMGKACPIPVIETRKILQSPDVNSVCVKVDNQVATNNLTRLANSIDAEITIDLKGENQYEVTIEKRESSNDKLVSNKMGELQLDEPDAKKADDFAVVIGSDKMGSGEDELGQILIKGFIYSLSQLDVPPSHVVFLNSGAFLTSEGSNTIDDLKVLEEKGTTILTCGTCANYYNITDKLAVGTITDMYGITAVTTNASKTLVY